MQRPLELCSYEGLEALPPVGKGYKRVAVTGAGGRTGSLVVQRLSKRPGMEAIATVRSVASKTALAQKLGCPESSLRVVDIAASPSVVTEQLTAALAGCAALVIATSAVPEMLPKPEGAPPGPPSFKWKEGQAPEQVDWLGQKLQVDAAKQAGVKHVVLVSSMGGTNPKHPLNNIAGGNILQWKRKAEQYLMQSGLTYTIIHPGGLLDEAGGARQLMVGVDDVLVNATYRSIPREDVAEVCVQSLLLPQYQNRSFDLTSMPPVSAQWPAVTQLGPAEPGYRSSSASSCGRGGPSGGGGGDHRLCSAHRQPGGQELRLFPQQPDVGTTIPHSLSGSHAWGQDVVPRLGPGAGAQPRASPWHSTVPLAGGGGLQRAEPGFEAVGWGRDSDYVEAATASGS
ncbi:hypothetical protein QJQ45_019878 [Haematococcus lacustris]|nr:hypothetical protein QJQ45_019878 [Haematococcus lacustris]